MKLSFLSLLVLCFSILTLENCAACSCNSKPKETSKPFFEQSTNDGDETDDTNSDDNDGENDDY